MKTTDAMTILPNTVTVKHNESEDEDRLSDLPDCILLHILSFLDAKYAIQTCILSSRWKPLWKCLPTLILRTSESSPHSFTKFFLACNSFTKFVSKVLSLRDGSFTLYAIDFSRTSYVEPLLLKRIVKYAILHNVRRLGLSIGRDAKYIPPYDFSFQTLTHLKLSRHYEKTLFPHVKLTMHSHSHDFYKFELCTPSLCTFDVSNPYQLLCGSNLSCLEQVDIDVEIKSYYKQFPLNLPLILPLILFSWLLEFDNVNSLIVSSSFLQALTLYPDDLLKLKLPSMGNLTSLKVKMKPLEYGFCMALRNAQLQKVAVKSRKEAAKLQKAFKATRFEPSPPLPDGIVDFLLQNSPSAKVNFINY